jgi:hypothetical protein
MTPTEMQMPSILPALCVDVARLKNSQETHLDHLHHQVVREWTVLSNTNHVWVNQCICTLQ